jgi:UDP-2,3-diacylglucosamine pyrophosphatase LpxH
VSIILAAISDLHLGSPNSYLNIASVRQKLIDLLKETATPQLDALFLVGDVIDLTCGRFPEPWVKARDFFNQIGTSQLKIERIFYIPGNHDHHVWVLLAEYQELLAKLDKLALGSIGQKQPLFLSTTYGYPTPMHKLFPPQLREKVNFVYPFHGFTEPITKVRFIFHHGHYFDPWITPLARFAAKRYQEIEKIELFNLLYMESLFYFYTLDKVLQTNELKLYRKFTALPNFIPFFVFRKFRQAITYWLGRPKQNLGQRDLKQIEDIMRTSIASSTEKDLWIFGHTHKRIKWSRRTACSAIQMFDLGGWVLNYDPKLSEESAWSSPAVFIWSSDNPDKPELRDIDLFDDERNKMLDMNLSF